MKDQPSERLPPSGRGKSVFYAVSAIIAVIVVGTIGFHEIEGMGWIDSFYFESMIATGQGPPIALVTNAGKIFASVMAFVSVGSVISALLVTLAPILSQLWREGIERAERDVRRVEEDISGKK